MPFRATASSLTFLAVSLFAASAVTAQTAPAPKSTKPMIGSNVFKWEDLKVRPTPVGERRDVADNPTSTLATFECHITTLNPGRASHEPHRHPQEELIIVKDGTLEVHINGRTEVAGPGSTFFYASNDAHAVKNVGDTRATYWVINLATTVTHTPEAHNPSPALRSAVFNWDKLQKQPTKVGARRGVLNGSTVTLKKLESHITTVNVGEASHAAHRHPDDEVVIVKEGTLEVMINDTTHLASAGSVLLFASNDLHGMRNAGDIPATYHVIRMVTAATPPR